MLSIGFILTATQTPLEEVLSYIYFVTKQKYVWFINIYISVYKMVHMITSIWKQGYCEYIMQTEARVH